MLRINLEHANASLTQNTNITKIILHLQLLL